jgi:hypothetical protein
MIYKHHIIPRHAGGTDEPSNMKEVGSLEEHSEEHRKLYEQYGRWQDKVAWKALSGQIPFEEATRLAGMLANKGTKKTKEFKRNQSIRMMGNKVKLGKKHTDNFKLVCANRMTGNQYALGNRFRHTKEQNFRQSERQQGISQCRVICPKCLKSGGYASMGRWHFDNCKTKRS